jgi:hypothetical protein
MAQKKVTRKVKLKSSKNPTPKDLVPADYNPRIMDEASKKGLKRSIDEFDDISGITWNKTTSNIITGHHRWDALLEKYGMDALTFDHLKGDRFSILQNGNDTGFILRVVEWNKSKERAANIVANSHKIEGQFTADLGGILAELKLEFDDSFFSDLRFDDLSYENTYLSNSNTGKSAGDDDWNSDLDAIKRVDENDQQMYANITITCKRDQKDRILELVKETLSSHEIELR